MGTADKTNVVLTGFMGTGKTVVGKALARAMDRPFYDTDKLITELENDSIARIFQVKGEEYFRGLERRVVRDVAQKNNCIIATGGGAIVEKVNFDALSSKGIIICLTAEPATVLLRTAPASDRPLLLKSKDAISTIRGLMKKRRPHYAMADYTIDTTSLSVDEVVAKIQNLLNLRDGNGRDNSKN